MKVVENIFIDCLTHRRAHCATYRPTKETSQKPAAQSSEDNAYRTSNRAKRGTELHAAKGSRSTTSGTRKGANGAARFFPEVLFFDLH